MTAPPPILSVVSALFIFTFVLLEYRHRKRLGVHVRKDYDSLRPAFIIIGCIIGIGALSGLLIYFNKKQLLDTIINAGRWILFITTIVYGSYYIYRYHIRTPHKISDR